jgi:DNA-binding response OmpR family regulator
VLLVYDEADYLPLVQHALHAADVPHELVAVEDGPQALLPAASPRPDVLVLGLTSPTRASVRTLAGVRGAPGGGGVLACGMSKSPDGADLLRGLGLGVAVWVTGFGDLMPLSAALRARHAGAVDPTGRDTS